MMKAYVFLMNGTSLGSWAYSLNGSYSRLVEMKTGEVIIINNKKYTIVGYHLNATTQSHNIYVQAE